MTKKQYSPNVGSKIGGFVVTKIKHGRKKNKGTHTLTVLCKRR